MPSDSIGLSCIQSCSVEKSFEMDVKFGKKTKRFVIC